MNHVSTYKILGIQTTHKNRMHTFKCFPLTTWTLDIVMQVWVLWNKKEFNIFSFYATNRIPNTENTINTFNSHYFDCSSLWNIFHELFHQQNFSNANITLFGWFSAKFNSIHLNYSLFNDLKNINGLWFVILFPGQI